ncbi:MAG: PhzF family phenazine biosynthesis protein [Blastocatellia bacterium]|nr:PhzF family phenazine biosynthesis protein [Blastocatellia bacterium]
MQLAMFQVDAFTDQVFGGNPAAVCPLEHWLPDAVMKKIAMENAVAETAFFIPHPEGFAIRWFSPEIELDLCGHATLATAHVLARHFHYPATTIHFQSPSGKLSVEVSESRLTLNFPSRPPVPCEVPELILKSLPVKPLAAFKARDYVLLYETEEIVRCLTPHQSLMNQINIDPGGVIVTAPGTEVDFVSRFFTPQASIFEDPVTGSAHCSLIPFWSQRLGRKSLMALQVSPRGGKLYCQDLGERVLIAGSAVTYFTGKITI